MPNTISIWSDNMLLTYESMALFGVHVFQDKLEMW
jgi:hypothetical protein